MNETLKAVGSIGAELGAVKAENEKIRGLLREALQDLEDWKQSFEDANHAPTDALLARISCALSQQPEPECSHCHGHGLESPEGSAPCHVCKAEPAPAQDEREAVTIVGYRVSMPGEPELGHWLDEDAEDEPQIQMHEPLMTVAQHERIVAALARPEQTEQSLTAVRNLLAVIHRDGGHHVAAVGLEQAAIDAEAEVNRMRAQIEHQPSATQQVLDLILEQCRYWHGRDEARRGGFACLYAAAKEIADKAARPAQTEQQPVCWASSTALAKLQNGRNNSPCVLTDGPAEFNDTPLFAAPVAQTELYTCIGKGGEYELIGQAFGAGTMRGQNNPMIYRDTKDGQLYAREAGDFKERMERATLAQPAKEST